MPYSDAKHGKFLADAEREVIWRVAQLGDLETSGPVAPPMILCQMRGEPGFPFNGVPWLDNRPLYVFDEPEQMELLL